MLRGVCLSGLLILFGLVSIDIHAKTDSARLRNIKPFERQIFVGSVLKQRTLSFQLTNALDRRNWVRYVPNNTYSAGIRLNLFGIGLEATLVLPAPSAAIPAAMLTETVP